MRAAYFLMALLYLALAGLAVLDSALASFRLLPPIPNLRWLVVHLVALGGLAEFSFGALPSIAAARAGRSRPAFDRETWLLLNLGLVLLLPGVALMNFLLITTGGASVFLAVLRLALQLLRLRPSGEVGRFSASGGLKFYLAGLAYLLVGIFIGTGLWQGWSVPLHAANPKEIHVHANLWGFTALTFAGLLVDFGPRLSGQPLAWPRQVGGIFWLMALGALGLVLGPWLDLNLLQAAGLAAHTAGSLLLVGQVFWPIRRTWRRWSPALRQILAAYVWFFLPVVIAPLVVVRLGVGTELAGSGGPLLIFGWIVQFLTAVLPSLFWEALQPGGLRGQVGSRISLAAANSGSLLYWISLFTPALRPPLRGLAFLLWLASLVPLLWEIAGWLKRFQTRSFGANSDLSR